LLSDTQRRINQYLWEGTFFLLALAVCIGVIARALRAEARIIKEQDSFLALVSHQFKTPLASLQLSLETMAMRPLAPEQQRTLIDRMLSDLSRMEAMVTQILESVRLERGRVDLRSEPLELGSTVARVVAQFEERAAKDHVNISSDIERGLLVLSDPLALDVVVRNLLENALAAVAPVGGGTITLAACRKDGEVELSVKDSGVGFRPADGPRLFEKFTRLHPGGGGSYYGTGLGLFIVRRLMQLAGGRVSAHSDGVGQGALFVLTWPAVAPGARP
jgi:signal transduction histidine kinase